MAGNRRRRQRDCLIGLLIEFGLRRWCCPFWNRSTSGKANTRDLRVPDVTDGVAQDRKRQEP